MAAIQSPSYSPYNNQSSNLYCNTPSAADKRSPLQITTAGRRIAATIQSLEVLKQQAPAQPPAPAQPEAKATEAIVPSQATIFKELGERLGISSTPKKGEGASLEAIIYYVESPSRES